MPLVRPLPHQLVELVAHRFRVLGQPTRLCLVDRLELVTEAHVQALVDELETTQQNVSKHLGVLYRAGIVSRRQEGRVAVYSLADYDTFSVIEHASTALALRLRDQADDQRRMPLSDERRR